MKLFYVVFLSFLAFTLNSVNSVEDQCDKNNCVKLKDCSMYKHLQKSHLVRSEILELRKILCKNKKRVCCPSEQITCDSKPNKTISRRFGRSLIKYSELPVPCNNTMVKAGECVKEEHCLVPQDIWDTPAQSCTNERHICCPVEEYIKINYDFNKEPSCGNSGKCVNFRDCPTYQYLLDLEEIDDHQENIWKNQFDLCSNEKICCPITDLQKKLLPSISDCRQSTQLSYKIRSGSPAHASEFPWIATIHYNHSSSTIFRCSGALFTIRHILTAAHCVNKDKSRFHPESVSLWKDSLNSVTNDKKYPIAEIIPHESYKPTENSFDIAIIRLARSVQDNISPICLPENWERDNAKFLSADAEKVIVGFHKTKLELMKSNVNLVEQNICIGSYNSALYNFTQIICARGDSEQAAEKGDSGIALAVKINTDKEDDMYWTTIGIHITSTLSSLNPGLYTNVSVFMNWITKNLN